jgi:ALG6, ALG8 glycosyltransferase family
MSLVDKRFGLQLDVEQSGVESTSRGLVGDTSFAVLPNVKPIHTFIITILFQSVSICNLCIHSPTDIGLGLPCQTMAQSDVQVVRHICDIVRICIVPIWLACS